MSQSKENPANGEREGRIVPQGDAASPPTKTQRRAILTDPVDEILIFSDAKPGQGTIPQAGDSVTGK